MIRRRHLGTPDHRPEPEPAETSQPDTPAATPAPGGTSPPARSAASGGPTLFQEFSEAPQAKEAHVSQRPESMQPARAGDQTVTVIGNGARLEGNLIAAASLRIEGTVTGTITAEGDVIVAPEAEVTADITSTNATIGGHYKGNVTATGTIELTPTARVEGNLTCRSLVVNQGAIFSGQSIMDGGAKKPAAAAAVPAPAPAPTPAAASPSTPAPTPTPARAPSP